MLLKTVARPRLFDVVFTMKLTSEQDEAVRAAAELIERARDGSLRRRFRRAHGRPAPLV